MAWVIPSHTAKYVQSTVTETILLQKQTSVWQALAHPEYIEIALSLLVTYLFTTAAILHILFYKNIVIY